MVADQVEAQLGQVGAAPVVLGQGVLLVVEAGERRARCLLLAHRVPPRSGAALAALGGAALDPNDLADERDRLAAQRAALDRCLARLRRLVGTDPPA